MDPAASMDPAPMDLGGTWRAAPADEDLRRRYSDPDFDDDGWEPIAVPGHWRSTPAFSDSDGPVLHRRAFSARASEGDPAARRLWLVFDGVFYQSDVWFDGAYLGDTEGYFLPHSFEITRQGLERDDHVLAVEVTCHPQSGTTRRRALTGVFQDWDGMDTSWNPGGIWRPVTVEHTGAVRIDRLRVLCRQADATRATLSIRSDLDSDEARTVLVRTTIVRGNDGASVAEASEERPLALGTNRTVWTIAIDQPDLWWPHALGDQPMYHVVVTVEVDGEVSHRVTRRVGIRRVTMRNWITSVNGERLFLKGTNLGPTRQALAEATPAEIRGDVDLARQANLDLVRVHGHVARPELYEAADDAGLLLWQDLPLRHVYARTVRKQAVRQAKELIDLIGHHPSVLLWCGHDEPFSTDARVHRRGVRRRLAGQQLPSWNKSVLDRAIRRGFEKSDPSRPAIASSGAFPRLPRLDGSDSHLYFGWHRGTATDLGDFCRRLPRAARFVSEFGAPAVPETADFARPRRWPALDWAALIARHGYDSDGFARHVDPGGYGTFAAWRAATQRYQAEVIRLQIELLRRLKYRPTGGFAQYLFADPAPVIGYSVLDHERVPKAGYDALRSACRPVIVVADPLPATLTPGDHLALDVHVVSDLRQAMDDATVTASLTWPGGGLRRSWRGTIPADGCARIDTLPIVVPDAPGPLTLRLHLCANGVEVRNEYVGRIRAAH